VPGRRGLSPRNLPTPHGRRSSERSDSKESQVPQKCDPLAQDEDEGIGPQMCKGGETGTLREQGQAGPMSSARQRLG
jgi:hypothetical protein